MKHIFQKKLINNEGLHTKPASHENHNIATCDMYVEWACVVYRLSVFNNYYRISTDIVQYFSTGVILLRIKTSMMKDMRCNKVKLCSDTFITPYFIMKMMFLVVFMPENSVK